MPLKAGAERKTIKDKWKPLSAYTPLAGGAIGDAISSFYEGRSIIEKINLEVVHGITDDTQLTMVLRLIRSEKTVLKICLPKSYFVVEIRILIHHLLAR